MGKLFKWLDNYWYHYKWVTVFTLFIALVVIIGVVQMANREDPDIRIVYCGPSVIDGEQKEKIESAFAQIMQKDYNEDGKKSVRLTCLTILSEEQLERKIAEAAADDDTIYYDPNSRKEVLQQLNSLLGSGETIICMLDDYVYASLAEQNAFASLEGILGAAPEYAIDEYSVRLYDLPFAKYFDCFGAIDDSARFCIRNMAASALIGNRKTTEKEYEWHKELFSDIFAFTLPEGWKSAESEG